MTLCDWRKKKKKDVVQMMQYLEMHGTRSDATRWKLEDLEGAEMQERGASTLS